MDCRNAIAIGVPYVFAVPMTDRVVNVTPMLQLDVNSILIGVKLGSHGHCRSDHRFNGDLLNVVEHPHHHLTTPLDQPQNRGLLFRQRAASPGAFQPSASPWPTLFFTASG